MTNKKILENKIKVANAFIEKRGGQSLSEDVEKLLVDMLTLINKYFDEKRDLAIDTGEDLTTIAQRRNYTLNTFLILLPALIYCTPKGVAETLNELKGLFEQKENFHDVFMT